MPKVSGYHSRGMDPRRPSVRLAKHLQHESRVLASLIAIASLACVEVTEQAAVQDSSEGSSAAQAEANRGSARPNVLLIMADDLGWSDVSMHGSRFHRTPHIDALAARGARFSNAYSASPLCSPTRASILTGRDPARHGVTAPMGHLPEHLVEPQLPEETWPDRRAITPVTATRIAHDHETLPEVFAEAGYETALFGKWHLGGGPHAPSEHGFEVVLGGGPHPGPPSYYAPFGIANLPAAEPGAYLTDVLVEGAVEWLESDRERPFFACLWFYQVHSPFEARDDLREDALTRVDANDPQRSATYAAMVRSLDDGVGRVLETLERLGLDDDTIVVFTSDNGGNQYDTIYGDVPGSPREGVPPTRNLPHRGGKGTIWEGGVRVPLAVVWPDAIADGRLKPGSVNDSLTTSTDLYPTLLALAGLQPKPEQALDGISLLPTLLGQEAARDQVAIFFPHDFPASGNRAAASVRVGSHKLVRLFADGEGGVNRELLFDLESSGGESDDLLGAEPEVAADLSERLDDYLERTQALLPVANPTFDPETERWQAGPEATIRYVEKNEGTELVIQSAGEDPWIATPYTGPFFGQLTLEMEVSSDIGGPIELFWSLRSEPRLSRSRSVSTNVESDGEWHTVQLTFDTGGMLGGLRLDPCRGEGEVRLRGLELTNIGGEVVREWRPMP